MFEFESWERELFDRYNGEEWEYDDTPNWLLTQEKWEEKYGKDVEIC